MRFVTLVYASLFGAGWISAIASGGPPLPPSFPSEVEVVRLDVTAVDPEGKPVTVSWPRTSR